MKKAQLYTAIILSFCSAQMDFMLTENYTAIFPRDRIIHTAISLIIAFAAMYLLSFCNLDNKAVKAAAAIAVISRAIYLCSEYISFFHTFHGSNTVGIILFTAMTALLFWKYMYDKTHLLYSFFIMFNITLLLAATILSIEKINVVNIYSNSLDFEFSFSKLPVLFDIVTVFIVMESKQGKICAGKRYLMLTGGYMLFITLLQGLCLKGNILYSVSPLQSLMQIASTETITRFDYIFTIYYTLNYLGAIMLYSWAVKHLIYKKKVTADEKV